jgi:hypothetical protein
MRFPPLALPRPRFALKAVVLLVPVLAFGCSDGPTPTPALVVTPSDATDTAQVKDGQPADTPDGTPDTVASCLDPLKDCPKPAACETAICRVDGVCGTKPMPSGQVCDDSDACSTGDQCTGSGKCKGTPLQRRQLVYRGQL